MLNASHGVDSTTDSAYQRAAPRNTLLGNHVVEPGEYLSLLAERAGYRDAMTVWNAPENEGLRNIRQNPQVLFPGDVIFIPDKQVKTVERPTTLNHVFVVKTDALKLRLVLLDFDNRPLTDMSIVLEVEGKTSELVSDDTGLFEIVVPRSARTGRLQIADLSLDLSVQIGNLDPVTEESGWRARLINLGYYRGSIDDSGPVADKVLSWALEEFQCDVHLKVTGKPDSPTLDALEQLHGS